MLQLCCMQVIVCERDLLLNHHLTKLIMSNTSPDGCTDMQGCAMQVMI